MHLHTLALLVPNLSVYSGQQGPTHNHQLGQKHNLVILPTVMGTTITGSLTLNATAIYTRQQYSQLNNQITRDFASIQASTDTLQNRINYLATDGLQNKRGLNPNSPT